MRTRTTSTELQEPQFGDRQTVAPSALMPRIGLDVTSDDQTASSVSRPVQSL